jgi:hypothetical protein
MFEILISKSYLYRLFVNFNPLYFESFMNIILNVSLLSRTFSEKQNELKNYCQLINLIDHSAARI